MGFFSVKSRRNRLDSAGRAPRARRMPTGLAETVSTAFMESVGNELSVSITLDGDAARAQLMREAEEISGLSSSKLRTKSGTSPTSRERVDLFRKEYNKFLRENPDAPAFPVTDERIDEIVRARRQERRDASQTAQAGETGFISGAARFLAGTAGFLVDPINVLSMGVAGGARSVLGTAVKQSGIAAAAEVPIQGIVQGQRTTIGEDPSAGEAAFAIGSAAVGAGLLGGAVAGGARLLGRRTSNRALLQQSRQLPPEFRTTEVRDAERVLEYLEQIETRNPFSDTPRGRAEHLQRLEQAYEALRSGRRLSDAFDTPNSVGREVTVKVRRGEPVEEFMQRVRQTDPELFSRIDKVEKDLTKNEANLKKAVDETPEVDEELVQAARRSEELRAELDQARKEGADRRRVKRQERKVEEAEAASPEAQKRAERLQKQAERGLKKQEQLRSKRDKLLQEKEKLLIRANRKAAKVDPLRRTIQENIEVMDRLPQLPEGVKTVAEFGQMVRALALSRASRTDRSTTIGQVSRSLDDIIEESPADQTARVDTMEAQVRQLAEVDEQTRFSIADDDGTVETFTAKELVDELQEDQKLISELQACVVGVLV